MTGAISQVRINVPATSPTTCVLLNTGHKHLIARRSSIAEVKAKALELYASGWRCTLIVYLQNGEIRQIVVGTFTEVTDHRIAFDGIIANGSELKKVKVVFYGDSDGYIELVD